MALQVSFEPVDTEDTEDFSSNRFKAQEFLTGAAFTAASVELFIGSLSSGYAGNVGIFAVDGSHKPTGSALATVAFSGITPVIGGEWFLFVFDTPTALSAATNYAIVIEVNPGSTSIWYYIDTDELYADGVSGASSNGISWSTFTSFDHPFRVNSPSGITAASIPGTGGIDVTPKMAFILPAPVEVPGVGGILLGLPVVANTSFPQAVLLEPLPITILAPGWDTAILAGHDPRHNQRQPVVMEQLAPATATSESLRVWDIQEGVAAKRTVQEHWYEIGHLLPRVAQELGNIISQQAIAIDFYNADRFEGLTITSVTDNLGSGTTIAGVPATPFTIASQDSIVATVTVATVGDLNVNASYTFHADTGDDYTFFITGTRIVIFPIRPETPMREHLVFETAILEADDGTEQRHALRKVPRGIFEMTIKDSRKLTEILLFDRQSKVVAFPAWHEPAFAQPITAADFTVTVNTTDYANFYVGGYAIVFKDEFTFDALRIDSMTSTTLTFDTPVSQSYVANTQVMPLLTAYFNHSVSATKAVYNDQTFNIRMNTFAEDNDIASAAAFSTYLGKPLLDDPNLITGALQEVFERKVVVLDNVTGLWEEYSNWDRTKRRSIKGFKTRTRQELWELRQFLHYLKGQQVSFYVPTFTKDLVPNQTLVNTTALFQMNHIGYNFNVRERDPKVFFRMLLKDVRCSLGAFYPPPRSRTRKSS